ncbi:hypothetical protein RJT34_12561 [Clitoria ternatea]|uniref:Uncharacterized protein n=1 Tax=Clitoria ternatea TaxID=43366 RepID=A0AAN9JQJ0_CLITE
MCQEKRRRNKRRKVNSVICFEAYVTPGLGMLSVNKPTIHRFFRTKDDTIEALCFERKRRVEEAQQFGLANGTYGAKEANRAMQAEKVEEKSLRLEKVKRAKRVEEQDESLRVELSLPPIRDETADCRSGRLK